MRPGSRVRMKPCEDAEMRQFRERRNRVRASQVYGLPPGDFVRIVYRKYPLQPVK